MTVSQARLLAQVCCSSPGIVYVSEGRVSRVPVNWRSGVAANCGSTSPRLPLFENKAIGGVKVLLVHRCSVNPRRTRGLHGGDVRIPVDRHEEVGFELD